MEDLGFKALEMRLDLLVVLNATQQLVHGLFQAFIFTFQLIHKMHVTQDYNPASLNTTNLV